MERSQFHACLLFKNFTQIAMITVNQLPLSYELVDIKVYTFNRIHHPL